MSQAMPSAPQAASATATAPAPQAAPVADAAQVPASAQDSWEMPSIMQPSPRNT